MNTKINLIKMINKLPVKQELKDNLSILINRLVNESVVFTRRELTDMYEKKIAKMQKDLNLYLNQIDGYKKMEREFKALKKEHESYSKMIDRNLRRYGDQKKRISFLEKKLSKLEKRGDYNG